MIIYTCDGCNEPLDCYDGTSCDNCSSVFCKKCVEKGEIRLDCSYCKKCLEDD